MAEPTLLKTPLFDWHQSHGGRIVEFGGWLMPVQYSTIIEEHQAVRQRVGVFDISHMGRLTFDGPGVLAWLERVTTNHVAKLNLNQIQYSLMANDRGGLIDDILVYRHQYGYYLVCNASNRPAVLAQLEQHRQGAVGNFHDRTRDTAMIAVQGPWCWRRFSRSSISPSKQSSITTWRWGVCWATLTPSLAAPAIRARMVTN